MTDRIEKVKILRGNTKIMDKRDLTPYFHNLKQGFGGLFHHIKDLWF